MSRLPRDSSGRIITSSIPAESRRRIQLAFERAVCGWRLAESVAYVSALQAPLSKNERPFVRSVDKRLRYQVALTMRLDANEWLEEAERDIAGQYKDCDFEIPGIDYDYHPPQVAPTPTDYVDDSWRYGPVLFTFPPDGVPVGVPIVEDTTGRFDHRFGGAPRHTGVVPDGCAHPMHLIFSLDLTDPRFPLPIEGIRRLPLYFPLQYNDSAVRYYVRSDDEIEIVWIGETEWMSDFPAEGYPPTLPEVPVSLDSPRPLRLHGRDADCYREACEDRETSPDALDFVEWACGLAQGAPRNRCVHPACGEQEMTLFAIVPNDDIYGMDLYWCEADGRFTYEICPRCHMIYAEAQA